MKKNRTIPLLFAGLALMLSVLPRLAAAEDPTQPGAVKHFSLSGKELSLANLAGEIRIKGTQGPTYEIDVTVCGDPVAIARVRFETGEGEAAKLYIQYPFEHENRFIYPPMGRGSNTSFRISRGTGNGSWTRQVLPEHRHGKIEIRGSGRGTEVWADVIVRVPEGKRIEVRHGAGKIDAQGVNGNVLLDSHAGPVSARTITGTLSIDTGSGSVTVADIQGDVSIDTGSGSVTISACSGREILIDTGSGSVDAEGIDCEALKIDTGSGQVDGLAVKADEALIDTGSGSIGLVLDRMGGGPYRLDTGSGAIDLKLPADASAYLTADTGSGRIHLDVSQARVRRMERTEVALVLGEGTAKVHLDTGSGSITVRQ